MRGRYRQSILSAMVTIACAPITTLAHDQSTLNLSKTLAAAPCFNHGNININGDKLKVTPGQSIHCMTNGGEVSIKNIEVKQGATFSVSALQHSHASPSVNQPQWADTSCTNGITGSVDCNVCADNVPQQFDDLFSSRSRKTESFWKLKQKTNYPPSNLRPREAFSPNRIGKHVQGFIKTGAGSYAGTYSHKDKGSIFFIDYDAVNDRHRLDRLHEAWNDHPSGMSLLGKFVIFGDTREDQSGFSSGRDLRVMPVGGLQTSSTSLLVENWVTNGKTYNFEAGGGVGMVKLNSNGYLVIATSPGGPSLSIDTDLDFEFDTVTLENPPKKTDFFYVEGQPNSVSSELEKFASKLKENGFLDMNTVHLGRWTQDQFGEGPKQRKYQYSENLTVIPECGTGDIYVINTSSTKPWAVLQATQPGYWRLSKVVWGSSGPRLDILSVHEDDQSWGACFHRAAATAWVTANHKLELYCSEYRMDDKREEDMHFKIRAIN